MRIKLYGETNENWVPSQLPLIRRGLLELGHELVENPADSEFLYSNDPCGYEQIVTDKKTFNKPAVLTIHDIPEFLPGWSSIANKYFKQAQAVDAICVNSKTTQNQIKRLFRIDSHVTYQPTKLITPLNLPRETDKLKFLYCGRANSSNKRFYLVRQLIEKYYDESQLVVIGSENPGFGKYLGMVDDEKLNFYYNLCDFILSPSVFEGLGLSPLEGILAGKYPIVAADCAAFQEFIPDFTCEPSADSMYEKIQEIESDRKHWDWTVSQYQRKFKDQLNYLSVVKNIIAVLENL